MHAVMKEKWNAEVTNGDTVYILGDVALHSGNDALISFVATLKGRKVLIKGNHDRVNDLRYKILYSEVYVTIKK